MQVHPDSQDSANRCTEEEFIAECLEKGFLSPLTACPGFSILEAVVIDWMHTMDLGILQDFIGLSLIHL